MSRKPRLLIIDDSVLTIQIMAKLLQSEFEVSASCTPEEVVDLTHSLRPDAVLLDIELGTESGFSLLKTIKETPGICDIPVILVSAHNNALIYQKGLSLGAQGQIVKPVDPNLLPLKVRKLMSLRPLAQPATTMLLLGADYLALEPLANQLFKLGVAVEMRGTIPEDRHFFESHVYDQVVLVDPLSHEGEPGQRERVESFLATAQGKTLSTLLGDNVSPEEECWAYRAGFTQVIPHRLLAVHQLAQLLIQGPGRACEH